MATQKEVKETRDKAEKAVRATIDEAVNRVIISPAIASLDAIVYSSCGGDLQQLIAVQTLKTICEALGQNPVDLLRATIKNGKKQSEGQPDARSQGTT